MDCKITPTLFHLEKKWCYKTCTRRLLFSSQIGLFGLCLIFIFFITLSLNVVIFLCPNALSETLCEQIKTYNGFVVMLPSLMASPFFVVIIAWFNFTPILFSTFREGILLFFFRIHKFCSILVVILTLHVPSICAI